MRTASNPPPVIAIDGPTASGKGTVAMRVADQLSFHYLDSGALYRLVAFASEEAGISVDDESGLGAIASRMQVVFKDNKIFLNGKDVTELIREEKIGTRASQLAIYPKVRDALLTLINRGTAPLQRVEGAYLLDTSDLSVDQAVTQVLNWYAKLHH